MCAPPAGVLDIAGVATCLRAFSAHGGTRGVTNGTPAASGLQQQRGLRSLMQLGEAVQALGALRQTIALTAAVFRTCWRLICRCRL